MRISVTDRCNLRCVYCVPETGVPKIPAEELLTDDEIIRITEAAAKAGVRHIKVTGGEPLLRNQIAELIRRIREIPGIDTVTLTTNGILLPRQMHALAEAGIRLFPGACGNADAQVEAYLGGTLNYNPDTMCNHHHHEGECGEHKGENHHCGGHCGK